MGSKSSKNSRDGGTKKWKKRAAKNNPRNDGSTQSVNLSGVVTSPFPNTSQYDQPRHADTLPRNQTFGDGPDHALPSVQPRDKLPQVPNRRQEYSIKIHDSHSYEDIPDQASPPLPPPPPRNKHTENGRKALTEDKDDYLEEKKGKSLFHRPGPKKKDSDNVYHAPESNSKPKVRADRNYEANYDSDISFRKGDILQLIKDGEVDGWYFVKNLTTGNEGYVPTNWVTMITSVDVESQKCFVKGLDREEAEEKLNEPEIKLGTYLLRPSGDGYALSLRCETELYETEIRHYRVRIAERGICYIETDSNNKPFGNITELIKYYTEKPGLRCKLKTPLPQDVPLSDLAVKFSDLKMGEQLGSGNFGSVCAGTLPNNRQVAVKSLKNEGSMTVEQFRKEAETMHKLRHPNLVSLLGICDNHGKIYIITERMSKGALLTLLREDSGKTIKFRDLMHMAIQVVEGMCYLERKGFVHRDLRAANVLVGDGNITKIADFGLARLLDNYYAHEDFYKEKKGSLLPYKWTALEAIKQLKFTVKSDVWSFGILLYEMVTYGDEPYAAMSNHVVLDWVVEGNRLKRPTEHQCPVTLYNIMRQCWSKNTEDRPNFADIRETLIEIKATG